MTEEDDASGLLGRMRPAAKEAKAKSKGQAKEKPYSTLKVAQTRIDYLSSMMRKPQKSLMESGNLPDLRKELEKVKAKLAELEAKLPEHDGKIRRIGEEKDKFTAEIDALKKEETRIQETLVTQWRQESEVRNQLSDLTNQKRQEEAAIKGCDSDCRHLESEAERLRREYKDAQARLAQAGDSAKTLPDKISRADTAVSENLTMVSEYDRRIGEIDREISAARGALDAAMTLERDASKEYEKVTADKNRTEAVFLLHDNIDRLLAEKDSVAKSVEEASKQLYDKQSILTAPAGEKKAIDDALAQEAERQRQLRRQLEESAEKISAIGAKFAKYGEVDAAAQELKAANDKVEESIQELAKAADKLKDTSWAINQAKKDLTSLNAKEDQLKRKLQEVLDEKQHIEEELQSLSDAPFDQDKLSIELPDVLREAIKKETERITAAQEKIKTLEKAEHELAEQVIKLREPVENNQKKVKAKEEALTRAQERLGLDGQDSAERQAFERELAAAKAQKAEIEAKIAQSEEAKRGLQAKMGGIGDKNRALMDEADTLKQKITYGKARLTDIDLELKSAYERKAASWAPGTPALRAIYPLKAQMDRVLGEKNRVKAELDRAMGVKRKVEYDMETAEKDTEKLKSRIKSLQDEQATLRIQIRSLEKQNSDRTAEKQTLIRQLEDAKAGISPLTLELETYQPKLDEIKNKISDKAAAKRQQERNIRSIEAEAAKAKIKLEAADAAIAQTEDRIASLRKKLGQITTASDAKNTLIIKALNEKHDLDAQIQQYKGRQSIIESEMKVIMNIYK
jgi:chromosome segregation ATPase